MDLVPRCQFSSKSFIVEAERRDWLSTSSNAERTRRYRRRVRAHLAGPVRRYVVNSNSTVAVIGTRACPRLHPSRWDADENPRPCQASARISVERPLQTVQDRRLARLIRGADDGQLPHGIAGKFKLQVAEQSEVLKFRAEQLHESSSSVPVSWPRCVARNRAAALHLSLIFFWIFVAETRWPRSYSENFGDHLDNLFTVAFAPLFYPGALLKDDRNYFPVVQWHIFFPSITSTRRQPFCRSSPAARPIGPRFAPALQIPAPGAVPSVRARAHPDRAPPPCPAAVREGRE